MNVVAKLKDNIKVQGAGATYVYKTPDITSDAVSEWRVIIAEVDQGIFGHCIEVKRESAWDRYAVFFASKQESLKDYRAWMNMNVEFIKVEGTSIFKCPKE